MFKILLFFLSLNLLFGGDFKQLCDRLKSGDERLFLNREFFYDLVDSDFACEDEFMRPFFDIAILIRGINVDCEGQKAIDDLQNFKFQFSSKINKYKNGVIEIFIEYSTYKMDEISWTN